MGGSSPSSRVTARSPGRTAYRLRGRPEHLKGHAYELDFQKGLRPRRDPPPRDSLKELTPATMKIGVVWGDRSKGS